MKEKIKLSLCLINESEHTDLAIELHVDNICLYDNVVTPGQHTIEQELDISNGEHTFNIVLKGKKEHHTIVNDTGEITNDVLIKVANVELDEINIDQLMYQLAIYKHDHNGHSEQVEGKFFGPMGCNGTVTLNFTSPFYLWLLENM